MLDINYIRMVVFLIWKNDILEVKPLVDGELDAYQKEIKKRLAIELANFPELPKRDFRRKKKWKSNQLYFFFIAIYFFV